MHSLLLALLLSQSAPETVDLDVKRYVGTWYEIARFTNRFERGCVGVTATYALKPDGELAVLNRCVKDKLGGESKEIKGKAWIPDKREPGKLKVQFFWPFSGPYWVIDVAPDYSWALIGHPDKDSCWIMARAPVIDEALYQDLVKKLLTRGYDIARLDRVPQDPESPVFPVPGP